MQIRQETARTLYAVSTLKAPLVTVVQGLLGDAERPTTQAKLARLADAGLVERRPYGSNRLMFMLTLAGRAVLDEYLAQHPKPELVSKKEYDAAQRKKNGYQARPYDPRVAGPRQVPVTHGQYVPPPDHHYRAGSMDYKAIPSKGF